MPRKVLWYISIIPYLQRLFRCTSFTQFMDYHACNRSQDDIMKIPTDGFAFKDIEDRWPIFKEETHNLKVSLATNGVNPIGEMRSIYLVWLFLFINNNILPWMSIKREHIMLAMIVPSILLFYSYLHVIISLQVKWPQ